MLDSLPTLLVVCQHAVANDTSGSKEASQIKIKKKARSAHLASSAESTREEHHRWPKKRLIRNVGLIDDLIDSAIIVILIVEPIIGK